MSDPIERSGGDKVVDEIKGRIVQTTGGKDVGCAWSEACVKAKHVHDHLLIFLAPGKVYLR